MSFFEPRKPRVGGKIVQREVLKAVDGVTRRTFLTRGLTLGGLALLSGCDVTDTASVQAWLFDPNRLAPTYPESMITRPFPFNAYYPEDEAPDVDEASYRLEVSGLVTDNRSWPLSHLRALPQQEQVTRHICSRAGVRSGSGGVPLRHFLQRIGADLSVRYVVFYCADDYFASIDMATALPSQTLLALTYDGQTLPRRYDFPMKRRMPTKLGYKNPKHIQAIVVTNTYPGGYWENQGVQLVRGELSGYSVSPKSWQQHCHKFTSLGVHHEKAHSCGHVPFLAHSRQCLRTVEHGQRRHGP